MNRSAEIPAIRRRRRAARGAIAVERAPAAGELVQPAPPGRTVSVDRRPHPITTAGRAVLGVAVPPDGIPLAALVAQQWPAADAADVAASLNGARVPVAAWGCTTVRPGDVVMLTPTVGRSGGGGTDPARAALQIAVVVAAIYVGGPAGVELLGSQFAASAASAAILVGGNLVVNAIAPPPLPDVGAPGAGPNPAPPQTPAYTVALGGNLARRYAPMPLVLGEHRLFPDLTIPPHPYYGRQDVSVAVYGCGLGAHLEVPYGDDWRIGNRTVPGLPGITYEATPDPITLSHDDFTIEAGGGELSRSNLVRRSPPSTSSIQLGFTGTVFSIGSTGAYEQRTINLQVGYRNIDSGAIVYTRNVPFRGDGINAVDATSTRLMPSTGTWDVIVRITTPAPADATRVREHVVWRTSRFAHPATTDYDGQTRIALSVRAGSQLSGRMDKFSVIARQKVPVWTAGAWSAPARSSNPAWIFRWFALGVFSSAGALLAGAGLPAARIDDETIKRWGAWCDAQGLRCDYVVNRPMSVHDVLTLIARCGRASPTWSGGKLGVVYEDAAAAPVALVTPGNVVSGSFRVDYGPVGSDEVVVRYLDAAAGWEYETIRRRRPGVTAVRTSTAVTLEGVTTRAQAWQAAALLAASQRYHRRRLTWSMGPAALVALRRGDVVRITHSLIDGGLTGRLRALEGARITLDAPVTVEAGAHVLCRLPTGALHDAAVVSPPAEPTETLTLATPVPAPAEGRPPWNPHDVLWRLYTTDAPPALARIVAITPRDDGAELVAIDESAAYHAAAAEPDTGHAHSASPGPVILAASAFYYIPGLIHLYLSVGRRWYGAQVLLKLAGTTTPRTYSMSATRTTLAVTYDPRTRIGAGASVLEVTPRESNGEISALTTTVNIPIPA